jgi:hypothetical protein
MVLRSVAVMTAAVGLFGLGCAAPYAKDAYSCPQPVTIEAAGLRAQWSPYIDRCTWFGASGGANMLHTVELEREPPADGAYTFFGGCYTWVAPQNGPLGWKTIDGAPQAWPPDPAMDIGPARVTGISHNFITTTGPRQISGLIERKTLSLDYNLQAVFIYVLRNESAHAVVAGPWITTAVAPDDLIAVRMPSGVTMRGWDGSSVERFQSILGEPAANGWALVDLSKARWEGGVKVYIDSPGPARAELAIWRAGHWFLRRGAELSAQDVARLREVGEGPVALYIEPANSIVEAELYGQVTDIAPGEETAVTEQWNLIAAPRGDLTALPN